jgi:large subunit ribosomal protein L21
MYAVIESGGKQYRVEVGTELEVDLLDAEPGQAITIERVLLVADGDAASIGQPLVANATVEAEVVRRDRGEKVIAFKYRPKARRRVKKGHRQDYTILRVTDVVLDGKSAAAAGRKADEDAKTERQRLEDAAAKQAAADAALAAKLADRDTAVEPAKKPARGKAKAADEAEAPKAGKKQATKSDAADADAPTPKRASRAKGATSASKASVTDEATDGAAKPKPKPKRTTKKDE